MVTIDEFRKKQETKGKLFLTKSERNGVALILGIDYPSVHFEEKNSFVNVIGGSVYYYSSVQKDEVLQYWDDITYINSAWKMLQEEKEKQELEALSNKIKKDTEELDKIMKLKI